MKIDHLSYSQINLFRTCPRQYHYRYVMQLTEPTTDALVLGSAVHDALSYHFAKQMAGEAASAEQARVSEGV